MDTPKTCSPVEVFRKYSGTLLDAISDPLPFVWKVYAKGIVTEETLQDVQVTGQPKYKMNSTILEAVRRAVKANQGRLLEFVTILEQQSNSPATDVAAMMRSDLNHESPLERYCKTCDQLVCQRCTIHLHQGHDHALVTDELKQHIEDCLQPHRQQLNAVSMAPEMSVDQISSHGEEVKTAQVDMTMHQGWRALQESKKQLVDSESMETVVHYKLQMVSLQTEEGKHSQTKLKSCLKDEERTRITVRDSKSPFTVSSSKIRGHPLNTITGINHPWGVAVSEGGKVVVSESICSHRISVLSKEGLKIRSFGSHGSSKGQFQYPHGIALTSDNRILVSDTDNHRIQVFTLEGRFITFVGQKGNGQLQFNTPIGISIHPTGKVLVADSANNCIQVLNCDLSYSHMLGSKDSGQGQFSEPWDVACDSSGVVYVTEFGNHCVKKLFADGQLITFGSKGSQEGQLYQPTGICVDSTDKVYVSEWGNHRVSLFNSNRRFLKFFGTFGSGEGQLDEPDGLAVDSTGNLFVCDSNNDRIVIIYKH